MVDHTDIDDGIDPDEADDRFIEALLSRALRPEPIHNERRVNRALKAIARTQPMTADPRVHWIPEFFRRSGTRVAVAASILLVVSLLWPRAQPGNTAYATVVRTLETARAPGTRHYRVVSEVRRPLLGRGTIEVDVYLDGVKRYAIRRRARPRTQELWFGRNGDSYWIIPPKGPHLRGDRAMLQQWLGKRDQMQDGILLLPDVLSRLAQDYALTSLDDEYLPGSTAGGRGVRCRRVRGVLRDKSLDAPVQIDVWADRESGVARKLLLDWRLAEGRFGVSRKKIELVGEPDLPPQWFDAEGH